MLAGIKKYFIFGILSFLSIACVTIVPQKIKAIDSTNRYEQYPVEQYNIPVTNISASSGYNKIYENNNFEYYYSTKKTILKIRNKASGFVWSTGADTMTRADAEENCRNISINSEIYQTCSIDVGPLGNGKDNASAYARINQMLEVTWLDASKGQAPHETVNSLSNDSKNKVDIQFLRHQTDASQWIFKVDFQTQTFKAKMNLRFAFDESGFSVKILDDEVTGENRDVISAIYPLPNLGMSGGKMIPCSLVNTKDGVGDCEFNAENIVNNPKTNLPGYIFIPDGSGALIRFDDIKYYSQDYYFDVYGDPFRKRDYTIAEWSDNIYIQEKDYVPFKQMMMPVWGVAYGNDQDAFVAYARKGGEYLGLVFDGRDKQFEYSKIKPRFERNRKYTYRFGQSTARILILDAKENFDYDIDLKYDFLHGDGSDGSLPANYIGMALKYRDYLIRDGLIKSNVELSTGPRVDFLICDVKNGLFGYEEVVATTTSDVTNILKDLKNHNIEHVNSSLFGWQNKGESLSHPGKADYNSKAGGKKGFKNVVRLAQEYDYEVSFQTQYGLINSVQFPTIGAYAVKALTRDYGSYVLADKAKPITWWHYTNPDVAMSWLNNQASSVAKLGDVGITINGVSTILSPDYGRSLNYEMAQNIYVNGTERAAKKVKLGANTPNQYLWKNLDNFYDIPVYNTQYLTETDSVPFLEVVLGGLVNMYAPYANLSFYDEKAMLKMVEYNLNPSFMITAEKNEDLTYTNSRDYFSTAYSDYKDIILEMNEKVISILKQLQGKTIVKRSVVPQEEAGEFGLYICEYAEYKDGRIDESTRVKIAINYIEKEVTYHGVQLQPLSATILEGV